MVYYPVPVHRLPVYRELPATMPVSEKLAAEVLSLPISPQIELSVQRYVAEQLTAIL